MASKGKKKKQQPMSLSQFHAMPTASADATTGTPQAAPSSTGQVVRINWADEMEKLDDNSSQPIDFVFDRSKLPTAPRSQLQPDIDLEQVPKRPPFKAYISNISFDADEEKLKNYLRDCKILSVFFTTDQGRFKGTGHVEFEDRDSLITALGKNESMFLNRSLRIVLNEPMKRGDFGGRQEGRGGFRQYGNRDEQAKPNSGSDEASWRRSEPESEPQQSYQQPSQQYGRYQSRGYQGGGQGGGQGIGQHEGRGGYQQRRQYGGPGGPGGAGGYERKPGYSQSGYGNGDQQQRRQYGGYQRRQGGQSGGEEQFQRREEEQFLRREEEPEPQHEEETQPKPEVEAKPAAELTERPKIKLIPRTLPVEVEPVEQRSATIFGSAKPVDTAAREREIEEKQKEKEKVERERQTSESANTSQNQDEPEGKHRSHKTSTASGDDQHQASSVRSNDQEGKQKQGYKHDNNNNSTSQNKHNRVPQSNSFTSPSSSNNSYHKSAPRNHNDSGEGTRPENAWKTRPAADLFTGKEQNQQDSSSDGQAPSSRPPYNTHQGGRHQNEEGGYQNRRFTKRPDSQQQNRPGSTRDNNKDRRSYNQGGPGAGDRNKGRNQRNERQFTSRSEKPHYDGFNNTDHHDSQSNVDLGFVNKFSTLQVDVDDVSEDCP